MYFFFLCDILETTPSSDPLADFKRERLKYKALRKQQGTKGTNREEITLAILDKFKTKLQSAQSLASDYNDMEEEKIPEEEEEEEDVNDLSWYMLAFYTPPHYSGRVLCYTLQCLSVTMLVPRSNFTNFVQILHIYLY